MLKGTLIYFKKHSQISVSVSLSPSLSPSLLGLAGFIEAKDDGSGGDTQSFSQIVITNKPSPTFHRPDALPVAQPTVSTH